MNLKTELSKLSLELPSDFFSNIQKYKEHLFKWNRVHNLTGAKDDVTLNNFIFDALYPLAFSKEVLDFSKVSSIMDIGSGAGFPGIMLALALPKTQVTLVEPLHKKASFLQFIKADLALQNLNVLRARVEETPQKHFDLITSRAVTQTALLLKLSQKFRSTKTELLFYKGEYVFNELDSQVLEKESLNYRVVQENARHYLIIKEKL